MYSRYHGRQDGSIELPRDYGGIAFSSERVSPEPTGGGRIEVARPTAHESVEEPHAPPPRAAENEGDAREAAPKPSLPTALPKGLLPMGKGFPIAHGIGFEEFLILGLMLLLSQSDVGSETVLWLCLLLFCG